MGEWDWTSPRKDFPRPLVSGEAPRPAWRPWILALLVLICFLPRAWAAWHWDVLWGDTLHYVYASEALERGDHDAAFHEFGINLYPAILVGLRHLGLDWQMTGKWWSVLMATLTVLPLWGWIRRMFDDRVALAACLCYAFHGKLVAISPLIIRDSTFWFLVALTLYCYWRATVEIRAGLFLAAGAALTLAVHTRTEGWLLIVPLVGWTAGRLSSAAGHRWKLVGGAALCLAMIPSLVTTMNLTWLRGHPHWELLRHQHVEMAMNWWRSQGQAAPTPAPVPAGISTAESPPLATVPGPVAQPPLLVSSRFLLDRKLLDRSTKGITYVGGLLMLLGLAGWWRIFFRREHLTLAVMNLFLLLMIRIRYTQAGLDIRYFMPMVIVATPWMALGFFQGVAWAMRALIGLQSQSRRTAFPGRPGRVGKPVLLGALAVLTIVASMADGSLSAAKRMRGQAELGRWIHDRFGPQQIISGNLDALALTPYYAKGQVINKFNVCDCANGEAPPEIASRRADMIVIWKDDAIADGAADAVGQRMAAKSGYRAVPVDQLPVSPDHAAVFVRSDKRW